MLCAIGEPAFSEPQELELRSECLASGESVELRITLRNPGSTDTAILLGVSIGSDRHVAYSFVVDVKSERDDTVESFRPDLGAIAGRVDPWILRLPATSEFSLVRPMSYFFSSRGKPLRIDGDATVRVRIDKSLSERSVFDGPALVKVFVGEIASEWMRIPGECHVG